MKNIFLFPFYFWKQWFRWLCTLWYIQGARKYVITFYMMVSPHDKLIKLNLFLKIVVFLNQIKPTNKNGDTCALNLISKSSFCGHSYLSLTLILEKHILCCYSVFLLLFIFFSAAQLNWSGGVTRAIVFVQNMDSLPLSPLLFATYAILFFFFSLSTEAVYAQANSDKTECHVCLFSRSALALYQFHYLLGYIYNLYMAILTTTTRQEIRCLENSFSGTPLCWFVLSRKPSAHVRGVNFLSVFCHTAWTHHQPPTVFLLNNTHTWL